MKILSNVLNLFIDIDMMYNVYLYNIWIDLWNIFQNNIFLIMGFLLYSIGVYFFLIFYKWVFEEYGEYICKNNCMVVDFLWYYYIIKYFE